MTTCLGRGCVEQSDMLSRGNTVQGYEEKMCNSMHKQFKFARYKKTFPCFSEACTKHDANICIDHTTYKTQRTNLMLQGVTRNAGSLFNQAQLAEKTKMVNPMADIYKKHLIIIKTTSQAHPDLGIRLSEIRMGIIY